MIETALLFENEPPAVPIKESLKLKQQNYKNCHDYPPCMYYNAQYLVSFSLEVF